jgi:hypothetical protein
VLSSGVTKHPKFNFKWRLESFTSRGCSLAEARGLVCGKGFAGTVKTAVVVSQAGMPAIRMLQNTYYSL